MKKELRLDPELEEFLDTLNENEFSDFMNNFFVYFLETNCFNSEDYQKAEVVGTQINYLNKSLNFYFVEKDGIANFVYVPQKQLMSCQNLIYKKNGDGEKFCENVLASDSEYLIINKQRCKLLKLNDLEGLITEIDIKNESFHNRKNNKKVEKKVYRRDLKVKTKPVKKVKKNIEDERIISFVKKDNTRKLISRIGSIDYVIDLFNTYFKNEDSGNISLKVSGVKGHHFPSTTIKCIDEVSKFAPLKFNTISRIDPNKELNLILEKGNTVEDIVTYLKEYKDNLLKK